MTALWRERGWPASARSRSRSATVRPPRPSAPAWRKSRREADWPEMVSMIESSGHWRETFGQQGGLQVGQPEAGRKTQARLLPLRQITKAPAEKRQHFRRV